MGSKNFLGLRFLLLNEIFTITHLIIVKILVGEFPVIQVVFIRCFSSALIILPILIIKKEIYQLKKLPIINLARIFFSTLAITINFFTISQIQLAQISTIGYLRPAIVSIIAAFILKEKQNIKRWGAIFIGFICIIFIFQPESKNIQIVAIIAILGVFCGSLSTILQKYLSIKIKTIPLMFWYSLGVSMFSFPFALYFWIFPPINQLLLMICIGLIATTAQFFFIKAYKYAEASFLAPMSYFHIIPTIFIGYFIFSEVPSINTIIGASCIIITLLYIAYTEKIGK